jgi:hypothetical protein
MITRTLTGTVVVCTVFIVLLVLWNKRTEYFYVPVKHAVCDFGTEPETFDERNLVRWTSRILRMFLKHLDVHHGSDARTLRAMHAWNGRIKIVREKGVIFRFSKRTGCLLVNPDAPVASDPPRFIAVMLRHLAHTTCCPHNSSWLDAYIFYLQVATEELGMNVSLECSDCTRYGVCYRAMCPRCSWARCEKL